MRTDLEMQIEAQVSETIRAVRERKGLSQEMLADALGLHRVQVCNIENGKYGVGVGRLYSIANALEVSVQELLP